MPANRTTAFLLVILGLSCAGCVHLRTPAERDASFSPYYDAKAGEVSLGQYLFDRSVVLLSAKRLETTLDTNSLTLTYSRASHGIATAIDRRGYFLTAAHAVHGQVWLAFAREGKLELKQARIIWRGDVKKGEPDLAILSISTRIDQAFEWATELTNGTPIVDLGCLTDRSGGVRRQCLAGKILEVSEGSCAALPRYTVVAHDSPLRPGDSGGPLALSDGRLLGINVKGWHVMDWGHLSFKFEFEHGEAHRPDLVWLRKVIDADAALFASEISSP